MKKVLLFLAVFCTMFGAVKAQNVDATISADEIQYWVGEGQNQVVISITWCSYTEKALAWGYRFDSDSVMLLDALTAIANADSRLMIVGAAPSNITYQDDQYNLTMCPNPDAQWGDEDYDAPMHSINGLMGQNYMAAEPIGNNDIVKVGGSACGIFSDDWSSISWTTPILPVGAPGTDVSFSPNFVQYWVGEGWNEVVFSVVWDGKALAWGYRFDEDTTTVQDAMDAIAASDTHFSVIEYGSYVSDFLYVECNETFRLSQVPYD